MSNQHHEPLTGDTEQEFQEHQEEIKQFVESKVEELGLHQTIRLLGHSITSETSLYRAENVEDGNPELATLFAQDLAGDMTYWAEAELGIQDIHETGSEQ